MPSAFKEWLADLIVIVACIGLNLYLSVLAVIEWTADFFRRKCHD